MYDAFISYRRENGFYIARLVRDQLKKRDISAFLDLEELRSGEFNKKLYEAIGNSKNFILILPSGALDRCVYEDDWVRKEILAAVELKRNIIPVLGENFEWPRALYSKLPEEICALEHFSGVNTSKDYLDAMIDRLISFMQDVNTKASANNHEDNLFKFVSTEEYFEQEINLPCGVTSVDMAFHAGAEWFTSIDKNDILYNIVENGIKINVLLNTPDAAEILAAHMRHKRKSYMSFEECLQSWKHFIDAYSDIVELRTVDIPILRRYYSFHMSNPTFDTVNVIYYTYANAKPNKNNQLIFHPDSDFFRLYRDEFNYLWSQSSPVDK